MALPEPSPRRLSAPDVLDKADIVPPSAGSTVGSFRYIYKDDQNRRRSFDTACLLTIRSASPQPQPHTPTSPHAAASLSPQLSPWLLSYPAATAHLAVRSEEEKAEQASREEVDVLLRRLVADRRQAMAFVRWLPEETDKRSMRLLMELVKLVERGEELRSEERREDEDDEKGERRREERVKDFSSAVAAVVDTHLRGKDEKVSLSTVPALPVPLFRFLLSFVPPMPSSSSSSSLLCPSPANSPVPSPYTLARRLLSAQRSSPSISPLSTATASSLSSSLSLSPHSPTSSRRRLPLLLHLLTQCVYALEQSLYEPYYLSFRTEWQLSLEAVTPQGKDGYTLRACLESATLYGLFVQWMGEERRHRLVMQWAVMYTAIQQTVDTINRVNKAAALTANERQNHDMPLINSSFSTPVSSSLSVRDAYQLFVSLETPYRFLHPEEHAAFLTSLPSTLPSSASAEANKSEVLSALASLLSLVVPACTRLDSLLSTSYFPAFCESPLFTQLPPYPTLLDIEQHHRYLSPQQHFVLQHHQLLDPSPVSLLSSPLSAGKLDALTSFVKAVYTLVEDGNKQPDVHKVEEFRDDLVPDGLVDDDDMVDEQMDQVTMSHVAHVPVALVSEKLQLASLPPSKRLEPTASPRSVADVDLVLPRPVLLCDAVVLNELQWKVEDERHPFLDSVNILRRVTPVTQATTHTATSISSSTPVPLFDPLPSSLPELSYVTNEQALQAELAVPSPSASSASSLLSMLGGTEQSSSAASSRVEMYSSYPTSVDTPASLLSLCFPLPPEPIANCASTVAAVDEFGFPTSAASNTTGGVQLLPVYTKDEHGSTLYGYVLQLAAVEEQDDSDSEQPDTAITTISVDATDSDRQTPQSRDSNEDTPAVSTGPPSPVNSSPSIALTRNDSSSFPSTPLTDLVVPDGPGSRLSSEFLANLQFVVTPPIEDRTLSNAETERKEQQRVRFQFDHDEAEGGSDSESERSSSGSRAATGKLDMDGGVWVNEPRTQMSSRPSLQVSTDENMTLPSSTVKRILEVSPLIIRNRTSEQQQAEADSIDSSVKAGKTRQVMVQYAVCVLSRRPLHTQLRECLLSLPISGGVTDLVSSPAYRALLKLTQPSTVPASLAASATSQAAALLPALDLPLDSLFCFLRPTLLLRLVESVALERRVVLTASSLTLLHLVSRGVLALLYPFVWQHSCVPALLPAQFDLLSSLPSCLLGVHSSHLPAAMALVQKSDLPTLLVDLDSDSVLLDDSDMITTDIECDGFPQCIRDALLSTMRRLYRSQGEMDRGHATSRTGHSEPTSNLLRVAFVKAWCQLLSSYRAFTLHCYHPTSPSVLFDRTAFLRCKPPAFTAILSLLTASSAFQAFLSDRCTPIGLLPVHSTAFDRLESVLSGERLGWQQVERERLDGSVRCVGRVAVVQVGEASVLEDMDGGDVEGALIAAAAAAATAAALEV